MWPSHSKHFPRLVDNTGNMPATNCNSLPQSAILLSHMAIFRYMAATLPATHRLHNCSNTLPVKIARLNVPLGNGTIVTTLMNVILGQKSDLSGLM
jgi:hypothetical protein